MATFTLSMVPRAAVSVQPHPGGARHRQLRRAAPAVGRRAAPRRAGGPGRRLPLPGRRAARAHRHQLQGHRRPHHRHHRQHRRRQDEPGEPASPGSSTRPSGTVLLDGVDLRDLDPDRLWSSIGLIPQKPYLFSGTVASNLQFGKPDATEAEMWEALTGRPGRRLRAGDARRARRSHRAGRHQRVGRTAPTAVDRAGARAQAGALRLRRLLLGARPRHRRPPPGGLAARTPTMRRW